MSQLDKLFYLAGVSADYLDYGGERRTVPHEVRLRILQAMGYPVADEDAINALVRAVDADPWRRWLRPFNIVAKGEPLRLSFHPQDLASVLQWKVHLEDGGESRGELMPADLAECGDYHLDGIRYSAREFPLPVLPPGYHRVELCGGDTVVEAELVVCPHRAFEASPAGDRHWGLTCQLYSLRSTRNWGIGDFGDLLELVDAAAPLGAAMIGLNPLHALCSQFPDWVSPYSPSDRRFYNPLYIAPEMMPGFSAAWLATRPHLARQVADLRAAKYVDYPGVSRAKYFLYESLYESFVAASSTGGDEQYRDFRDFIAAGGDALEQFCRYEMSHNPYPETFGADPEFFAFLQWLCARQLGRCSEHARARGMAVGLVGDLAVGAVAEGSEVAAHPRLYRPTVTIGAPPDPFSSTGQDWGLPVMDPLSLRADRFRHIIGLLRANMTYYGALRIDHVMSLMRLWWCLPANGTAPQDGAYVYYPFHELLSLVKLESHRCGCQVIGEDLGVVAGDLRRQMDENGLLGNTLFYFDQHLDRRFRAPGEQREAEVMMITNHDVPTLADWWSGGDIHRRYELGVIADQSELTTVESERDDARRSLLALLAEQQLLPPGWSQAGVHSPFDFSLGEAIHRLCARASSRWILLQLEDLQQMSEPVNIPGTFRQYPNWRRKQSAPISDIFSSAQVRRLLGTIQDERKAQHT